MSDAGASDDRASYDSPSGQNTAITGATLSNPVNIPFLQQNIPAIQTENTIFKLDASAFRPIPPTENTGISSITAGKEYDFTHIVKNWATVELSQNIRAFSSYMKETIQSQIGEPWRLSRQEVEFGIKWDVGPFGAYYKFKNGEMLPEHQEKLSAIQDRVASAEAKAAEEAMKFRFAYIQPDGTPVFNATEAVSVEEMEAEPKYKHYSWGEIAEAALLVSPVGSGARLAGALRAGLKSVNIFAKGSSKAAQAWRVLEDGTNQGMKHYFEYMEKFPERIPGLARRLGIDASQFTKTAEGFEKFTEQAMRVIDKGVAKDVGGGKVYHYLEVNAKEGVLVIIKDGKIDSMMSSNLRYFNNLTN